MCWISFLFLMKLQTQYQSLTSKNPIFHFNFLNEFQLSRGVHIYTIFIYINIETGCIGNMSNRICIKSRWQFWMQLYSNCNLITRDPSLPQTSFTLSGDRILSRLLLLQQWNRQLLRIFENDVITRFIDNFSFEQCSIYPESTYTYTQWMSTNWPAVACWE